MNTHFSPQVRQGRLSTSLGADKLVLLHIDGTEELSGDFEWWMKAVSTDSGLDLGALLVTHATVDIDQAQRTRDFDGIVCEAQHRGSFENIWRYDLVLRLWLHVAGLRRNMLIFHDKSAPQIVQDMLGACAGLGNPQLDVRATGSYPVLKYTVQYGETAADFIRHQLERNGISWAWCQWLAPTSC